MLTPPKPILPVRPVIDTQQAITCFHECMQAKSTIRLIRLLGETLMGKSYLLTRIFPELAKEGYQARCAILDLRQPPGKVSQVLHSACSQLGIKRASKYRTAYRQWGKQPNIIVKNIVAIFSLFIAKARESVEETPHRNLWFTAEFIDDLASFAPQTILLLIDSVDDKEVAPEMRNWLFGTFLVQALTLEHVRIVVAGRSLPMEDGSYIAHSLTCALSPILDENAYFAYCKTYHPTLPTEYIPVLARASAFTPGLFAALTSNWSRGGSSK